MLLRVAGATLVLAVVAGVTVLRRRWGGRPWWTVGVAIVLISVPLWVPLEPSAVRAVAAALAIAVTMKTLQLQAGLAPQPALERRSHFVLWLLLPPRTLAATTNEAKAEVRRQGLRRWARAVAKATLLLALVVLCARQRWPWPFSV